MSDKLTAAEYRTAAKVMRQGYGYNILAATADADAANLESAERNSIPETAWEKYAEAVDELARDADANAVLLVCYKDKASASATRRLIERVYAADPRRNPPAPVKDEPTREQIEDALAFYSGSCDWRPDVDDFLVGPADAVLRATIRKVWADRLQDGV